MPRGLCGGLLSGTLCNVLCDIAMQVEIRLQRQQHGEEGGRISFPGAVGIRRAVIGQRGDDEFPVAQIDPAAARAVSDGDDRHARTEYITLGELRPFQRIHGKIMDARRQRRQRGSGVADVTQRRCAHHRERWTPSEDVRQQAVGRTTADQRIRRREQRGLLRARLPAYHRLAHPDGQLIAVRGQQHQAAVAGAGGEQGWRDGYRLLREPGQHLPRRGVGVVVFHAERGTQPPGKRLRVSGAHTPELAAYACHRIVPRPPGAPGSPAAVPAPAPPAGR